MVRLLYTCTWLLARALCCVGPFVAGSHGRGIPVNTVRSGIPVDPAHVAMQGHITLTPYVTGGRGYHDNITRSEAEKPGYDCSNKEQPGPGRGDRGWAAICTELCFNMTTARSRRTAEAIVTGWLLPGPGYKWSGPGKLPVKRAAKSKRTAEAIKTWWLLL